MISRKTELWYGIAYTFEDVLIEIKIYSFSLDNILKTMISRKDELWYNKAYSIENIFNSDENL